MCSGSATRASPAASLPALISAGWTAVDEFAAVWMDIPAQENGAGKCAQVGALAGAREAGSQARRAALGPTRAAPARRRRAQGGYSNPPTGGLSTSDYGGNAIAFAYYRQKNLDRGEATPACSGG